MLKLIDRGTVPPGGFRYFNVETKTWVSAPSYGELVPAVTRHRSANNLPISSEITELVEDQMCQQMPPGTCNHGANQTFTHKNLTLDQIITGTRTLASFLLGGRKKVSKDEANTRADTCSACMFNQPISSCTTCSSNAVREMVVSVVGAEQTRADSMLGVCGACGCSLKAKVWFPLEMLQSHMTPEALASLPEWCWCKPK